MVLSKQTIEKLIALNELTIRPYNPKHLGACSYDLHLGNLAVYPESGEERKLVPSLYLLPNEFVLIQTEEYLNLPADLIGHVVPRSSAARLGLLVNFGSELIHPSSSGKLVLEIKNLSSKEILLQKGLSKNPFGRTWKETLC